MKSYFKQSLANGLYWFLNVGWQHFTLRFAGKPSFLLEKLIEKHGKEQWQIRYHEMLELLKSVWDDGRSPFVLYINEKWENINN